MAQQVRVGVGIRVENNSDKWLLAEIILYWILKFKLFIISKFWIAKFAHIYPGPDELLTLFSDLWSENYCGKGQKWTASVDFV